MTIWILAVVILAFVGTVCVWVGLDALNGSLRLLHGDQEKPEKRVAGRVEDTGHLSADASHRIHRQVRGIH